MDRCATDHKDPATNPDGLNKATIQENNQRKLHQECKPNENDDMLKVVGILEITKKGAFQKYKTVRCCGKESF